MMKKLEVLGKAVFACILCSNFAFAESGEDAWSELVGAKLMKRPEFAYVQNNPDLPNILIYGDSISMDYTLRVREKLKDKANVYRVYCNGGDTEKVIPAMRKVHDAMSPYWSFNWDVIHFNSGLHDLKYLDENGKYDSKNGKQVRSAAEYADNLKSIFAYFGEVAPDAKIIYATTTPVPQNSSGRKAGDALKFNEAALKVCKDYPEIEINDLYALTKPNFSKWRIRPGNVHYNQLGQQSQGDEVANVILKVLATRVK